MTQSKYMCPVCELPLSMEDTLSGGVAIWCTHKNCPSHAASNGAEAKDEAGAHYQVQRQVQQELAQNERHGPMCSCIGCMDRSIEDWSYDY